MIIRLKDALENGYEFADRKYTQGYVSVKEDPMNAYVWTADGNRKGELYVLIHNPNSTRFCIRQYLRKKEQ